MQYKLAKQLKEAGFPQTSGLYFAQDPFGEISVIERFSTEELPEHIALRPTLSELIEACGDDFRWLKHNHHAKGKGIEVKWMAQGRPHPISAKDIKCFASTPEEAIARLWLALNPLQAKE